MSQLLQPFAYPGYVQYVDDTGAPDGYTAGLPVDKDGVPTAHGGLASDSVSAIARYNMGLPLTADGRVAVETAAVARFNGGAMPLTAAGRLAVGVGPVTHHLAGVGYNASDQVVVGAPV